MLKILRSLHKSKNVDCLFSNQDSMSIYRPGSRYKERGQPFLSSWGAGLEKKGDICLTMLLRWG